MDVILLCGGFGTRIEPIGLFIPKALLPIKGRPLIDYIIDSLDRFGDIDRLILSTNRKFADQFEYYMKAKKAMGFKKRFDMIVEPTRNNDEKLGAVKAISYVIKEARIDSDTMIIAGDNFYDFSIEPLMKHFNEKRRATLVVYDTNSIDEAKRLGVVEVDGYRIVSFEEKPERPKSTLISTGIYAFPKDSLVLFDAYLKGGKNPDAIGYFIKWYIGKNETHGVRCAGRWFDIGTLETYQKVFNHDLKE
jgi:glucose-1-phosphate thymidylyltransferase